MQKTLQQMQAEMAELNKQIQAAKALQKLEKCKVSHRTAAKYFDLQQAYMDSVKGIK